ncbi:MAG: hypothetical protein OXC11_08605, partial [Rhodospirillales bacterium]|nr:hypothetical protein [Rhodospirillales bacterium]
HGMTGHHADTWRVRLQREREARAREQAEQGSAIYEARVTGGARWHALAQEHGKSVQDVQSLAMAYAETKQRRWPI